MNTLERRYRRLLACYPRDHRERSGEEMLGVLLADAGDRTKPGAREAADLLWGAFRLHLRRVLATDGGVSPRDVLAIVGLLGPVAILAGAAPGLHELAWWIKADALGELPWQQQIPDAPVWVVWFAAAVFALTGMRRTAAVGAWVATAGFVVLAFTSQWQHRWTSVDAGWILLSAVTAIALTWAPGPDRGRELVGRRAVAVLAATVVVVVGLTATGSSLFWLGAAASLTGTLVACGVRSRPGRRAALILQLPLVTGLISEVLRATNLYLSPDAVIGAISFGVPTLVLLAVGGLPRTVKRRPRTPLS